MIALGILYAVGFGALIAGAAAAVEWAAQGRMPTRHLWTIAIVATVVIPPIAVVRHSRVVQRSTAGSMSASASQAIVDVVQLGRDAGAALGSREQGTMLHTLRTRFYYGVDRIEHVRGRTIVELWAVASLGLLAWVVVGLAHWQRERREWEETEVDGVSVHLSDEVGPAVLGIITQRIVLPAWARMLAPEYRELMLAHECEHIAAGDPQRLALAVAALVLMPWNPALWWCAARMRRAIEVDCDARVLRRHPLPRQYGYLLLQVAARGTNAGPLAVPLVSLLRLPSELELRLRAMTRPRTIGGRTALAGVTIACAALAVAFTTPVPRIPALAARVLAATREPINARASATPRAWVRVRDSVVELDSVSVDPVHDITRGVLPPGLRRRIVRDTLPSAVAEDSIQRLARQLAQQGEQLDSVRARAESLDAEMRMVRAAREVRIAGGAARIVPKRGASEEFMKMRAGFEPVPDLANPVAMQRGLARSAARVDSALARYYPKLATDASATTLIWFVADSSGKILHTTRDDDKPFFMSTELATERFPDVDPHTIDFVSIRKWSVGTRHIAVAWIGLKR